MQARVIESPEALLAVINRELEVISETQHRLAHRKAILQEQATRLRLGASPTSVRLALEEQGAEPPGLSRWRSSSPRRWRAPRIGRGRLASSGDRPA